MEKLEQIFKALSDRTRIAMLALLINEKELCVCRFMEALSLSQSKASRHLRYMYNSGLLKDRHDGIWVHYRVSEELTAEGKMIIKVFKKLIEEGFFGKSVSQFKKTGRKNDKKAMCMRA